jgi:hypothetical protein
MLAGILGSGIHINTIQVIRPLWLP